MPSDLKEKVKKLQIGKNTAAALVTDVKEIMRDRKEAAVSAFGHALKGTKQLALKAKKRKDSPMEQQKQKKPTVQKESSSRQVKTQQVKEDIRRGKEKMDAEGNTHSKKLVPDKK